MVIHVGGRGFGHSCRTPLHATGLGGGGTPAPTYQTETTALLSRMTVQPDSTRAGIIDDLILGMKNAGIWTLMDGFYVYGAHDRQAALLNWKSASFNCVENGAGIAWTANQGYTGDGATAYLETNFNPSTAGGNYTLNSMNAGVFQFTTAQQNTASISALNGTTTVMQVTPWGASGFTARANDSTATGGATDTAEGYYGVSRTASNARPTCERGQIINGIAASTLLPNKTIQVLRNGTVFCNAGAFAAHFGGGLTTTQQQTLATLLRTYYIKTVSSPRSISGISSNFATGTIVNSVAMVGGVDAPIEPSIYDTVALGYSGGLNGKRYWMAFNEYAGDDQVENPSVVNSDDGITWATPAGGTNPVFPAIPGGIEAQLHNSDARLFIPPATAPDAGTIYLFNHLADTRGPTNGGSAYSEEHFYKTSTDFGVTWSAAQTTGLRVAYVNSSIKGVLMDGAFIYDYANSRWLAWTTQTDSVPQRVDFWVSGPTLGGTWTKTTCIMPWLPGTNEIPWHLDVKAVSGGGYALAISSSFQNTANTGNIYFFYTSDGHRLMGDASAPIAAGSPFAAYRPSLVQKAGGWDLWTSDNAGHKLYRFSVTDSNLP